jgi:hypothetical protein
LPNTTYLTLPYPALSNSPNVPQDLQNLASGVDTKLGGVIICTSSTRPTARNGATIYETDTTLHRYYNGSAWVVLNPKRIFTHVITADSTTWSGTESGALMTVTGPVVSGERYKIEFYGKVQASAVGSPSTEVALMRIREDNASGTEVAAGQMYLYSASSVGFTTTVKAEWVASSTATKTFVFTGQRNGGANTHFLRANSVSPCYLSLDLISR